MGSTARQICSQPFGGKVLASVTDTIYLKSDAGGLFWIIAENMPLHWRSIRVQGQLPRISEGTVFSGNPDHMDFENGIKMDLSRTTEWQARMPESTSLFSINSIYQKAVEIYQALSEVPSRGWGHLIPGMLKGMRDPTSVQKEHNQDPILQNAWPHIQQISLASSRQNFKMVVEEAQSLIGLGSGLTPSGDDFLGGLFFAFHFLANTYPGQVKFNRSSLDAFLDRNQGKTNLISFTLMQDLSRGHGLAPLHEFVGSMASNQSNELMVSFALELAQIGNSTGWDILTGVLAGLFSTRSFSKECR